MLPAQQARPVEPHDPHVLLAQKDPVAEHCVPSA
jgi:hypothetical protein